MISTEDYLTVVGDALNQLVAVLEQLGDDRANARLATPGANSPYAVVTHCLGVMEYWGGFVVAGRTIARDRDGEFRAGGPVAPLVERVRAARAQLADDVRELEPSAPPRGADDPEVADLVMGRTQGGALVHLYEELCQHLGQVEVTRDVLLAHGEQVLTTRASE